MKYNGNELVEMTPNQWDGKPRTMLVWDDFDDIALMRYVIEYAPKADKWLCYTSNFTNIINYDHCAEIPEELVGITPSEDETKPVWKPCRRAYKELF